MADKLPDYDVNRFEYKFPQRPPGKPRGRPTCVQADVFTVEQLKKVYARTKSVRKTGAELGVSPTTVKKYLKGKLKRPGAPAQPHPWKAQLRSEVHQWFIKNKDTRLPRTVEEIVQLSGFPRREITRYLSARRNAALSYLASLPEPNTMVIVFRDTEGQKIPSSLIVSYTLDIDKVTFDVTLSAIVSGGGFRVIRVPFREYESALRGRNPELGWIGLVRIPR